MRHICAFIFTISFFCGITSITVAKSNNATKLMGNNVSFTANTLENKSGRLSQKLSKRKAAPTNHLITNKQSAGWLSAKNKRKQRVLQMIERAIQKASKLHQLPPSLIRALIHVESSGNRYAISKANAKGLTQLLPITAKEMGVRDPFDIEQNIIGGSGYLKKQLQKFENLFLGLVAYNWGPRNALRALQGKKKIPQSVRRYANRIIRFYRST